MARQRRDRDADEVFDPPRGPAALVGGAVLGAAAGSASLGAELAVLGWSGVGAPDPEAVAVLSAVYVVAGAMLGGLHGATGLWGGGWALAWAFGVAGLAGGVKIGGIAADAGMPAAFGVALGMGIGLVLAQPFGRVGRAGPFQLAAGVALATWCAVAIPVNLHLLPSATDGLAVTVDGALLVLCGALGAMAALVSTGQGAPWPHLLVANGLAWGAWWLQGPAGGAPPEATADGRPVVLITVEGLRADVLARGRAPTPALAALAERSARYPRHQAAAPWVIPSLGSIQTGLLPHHHGAGVHDGGSNRLGPLDAASLGQLATRHGVVTGAVVGDAWLDAYGFHQGYPWYQDTPDRGPLVWWVDALGVAAGSPRWPIRLDAAAVTDRALRFTGAQARGGWLLWVHYADAGRPFLAAEHDRAAVGSTTRVWPVDAWEASLLALDRELGRLVAGLPPEALVIVVGTHGVELEEGRERFGLVPGSTVDGHGLQQELIGVPLWVSGPGVTPGDHGRVVSGVDVLPTALAALGADPPAVLDGYELTEARGARFDDVVEDLADRTVVSMAVRWGWEQLAARSGDDKLVVRSDGSSPLHDLAADPAEIAARPADARNEQLERRLRGALPPGGAGALFERPGMSERFGRWLTSTWARRDR